MVVGRVAYPSLLSPSTKVATSPDRCLLCCAAALERLSDPFEAVPQPAGVRHEFALVEGEHVGETIRASKTITDDDAQLEQACVLAVGIEVEESDPEAEGFPVERVCQRVTRSPRVH